jgi:two-component system, chemotaxis family, chemotaxis protein CheY
MPADSPIIAIIDDDRIFQLTAAKTILATALTDKVLQFVNPEEALQFLKSNIDNPLQLPDFVFLDINMPFLDGWMFLEDYAAIKPLLSKPITIYMVSSSIDPRDIERAKNNSEVSGYVVKPVTREKFIELLQRAA